MSEKLQVEKLTRMQQEELGYRLENEEFLYLMMNYEDVRDLVKLTMSSDQIKKLDESLQFLENIYLTLSNKLII